MKNRFDKSRRTFIVSGLSLAGGLTLGFNQCAAREQTVQKKNETLFRPNAWLTIEKDNQITIMLTESEMGQGVMTSLPMLIADELDAEWDKVKVVQAPVDPVFGWQGTGGSTSVRQAWEPLRQAGAAARQMLLQAAGELWQVPVSECKSERGKILHRRSAKQVSYGELVPYAVQQEVPDNPRTKAPDEYRLISRPIPRIDIPAKVTGKAVYGMDVTVPGMLIAAIRHCPVFGGRLKGYNKKLARTIQGIKAIVPLSNAIAVVADDYWSAQQAVKQLSVNWDLGKNSRASSANIEARLKTALRDTGNIAVDKGDATAILAQAKDSIKVEYSTPYQAHATMEPMCCTAHVTENKCEVWVPTQQPSAAQNVAAKVTGLPKSDIHIHTTLLGGGFGRRNIQDFVDQAVRISQEIKKPVKLIWSREEDMQHGYYHPATCHRLEARLARNGMPRAWRHKITGSGYAGGANDMPYAIANIHVATVTVNTGIPLGPWRSVSYAYNVFVTECFIDELAVRAKQDPVEYRLKLLSKEPRLYRVLKTVAEKSNWKTNRHNGLHLGVAITASFGSYVAQVVQVSVHGDGQLKVDKITCVVDCGTVINPDTATAQIEGSIIYALTATLKSRITIDSGRVVQSNFHDFPLLTFSETPVIEVHLLQSNEPPGGLGEPAVPPLAPAVVNAIYSATRMRQRKLPVSAGKGRA